MAQSLCHQCYIRQAILIAALFFAPASSTSRSILGKHGSTENGFRVDIRHVDSTGNYTKHELIERAIERGKHRFARLSDIFSPDSKSGFGSPVQNRGVGEFVMHLAIGTPPFPLSLTMDTGSDLVWTECQSSFQCHNESMRYFYPENSTTYTRLKCSNKLCKSLVITDCKIDGCSFIYTYADQLTMNGNLGKETFWFGNHTIPELAFGCGVDDHMEPKERNRGIVGLGRGPLSLVSQLHSEAFSYCLPPIGDTKNSSLLVGKLAKKNSTNDATKTTPLIKNPKQPSFYYISLEGISVGGKKLSIPKSTFALNKDGSGGLIIDSGTSFTFLHQAGFNATKKAFAAQMKLPVAQLGSFDLCFSAPANKTKNLKVPSLVFHFDGADVELPEENYMIREPKDKDLLCLAMYGSGTDGMSILGSYQQQNMLVLHDLENGKVSFTPTKCVKLYEI